MPILEAESRLTERYQTTVPAAVRKALQLRKHDTIVSKITTEGTVVVERASTEPQEADPAIGRFLDLLERDIAAGTLRPVSPGLPARIEALVGDLEDDLEKPLDPEDEDGE